MPGSVNRRWEFRHEGNGKGGQSPAGVNPWRPIVSAPRDGSAIEVKAGMTHPRGFLVRWNEGAFRGYRDDKPYRNASEWREAAHLGPRRLA